MIIEPGLPLLLLIHAALTLPASLRDNLLPSTVRENLPQHLEALTAGKTASYFKPLKQTVIAGIGACTWCCLSKIQGER